MRWTRIVAMVLCVMLLCTVANANTWTFPSGITEIGESVCEGNKALNTVVIPNGVTTINDRAFADSGLTRIVIPSSVTWISDNAFDALPNRGSTLTFVVDKGSEADQWLTNQYEMDDGNYTDGFIRVYTNSGISLGAIINEFEGAYARKLKYATGGSSLTSGVDCSGLFYAVFKKLGGYIYHGTNTMWKSGYEKAGTKYVTDRRTLTSVNQLTLGDAVFQSKDNDVNHIALVVEVRYDKTLKSNRAWIIHSRDSKSGVVREELTNYMIQNRSWNKLAHLAGVNYGDID